VDGHAYSKTKLDAEYLPGGILDKGPAKLSKETPTSNIKKEDVDIIVCQFQ
jgi:hypothetical protein